MANLKTLSTIDTSPFKRLVLQLGGTPSVFSEGMTYYELLAWLVNFLEKEVAPKTNENIEAVKELQEFVSNYFDNLDVQEEINNKLDQMAEDGTLAEIITAYLNVKSILAYDNVAAMKSATNIIDGSFLATYGKTTLNDGYGAFYKARQIRNTDVVDEVNIIALSDANLVAELITNATITSILSDIENVRTEINTPPNMLVIGDSWSTVPPSESPIWHAIVGSQLNCNVLNYAVNGSGFTVGNTNFDAQATQAITDITEPNKVKYIYVVGILNDLAQSSSLASIYNAQVALFNKLKTNFPKAKIMYVTNNRKWNYLYNFDLIRNNVKACQTCGIQLIDARKFICFNPDYFQSDSTHLTTLGNSALASVSLGTYVSYPNSYSNYQPQNITITSTAATAPTLYSDELIVYENKMILKIVLQTIYAGTVTIHLASGMGIYKYNQNVIATSGDNAAVRYNAVVNQSTGDIVINAPNNAGAMYITLETDLY